MHTCKYKTCKRNLYFATESRHPSGTVNFPTPTNPTVKTPVKTPYCKVSKLKKTQPVSSIPPGTKLNHTTVRRTVDQANLSSGGALLISSSPRSPLESIQVQNNPNVTGSSIGSSSPVKSPGTSSQPRRKRFKTDRSLLKDREYDPDRHCGVWNEETGKPCTRSLTCKAHTVSLRRTVVGRSKTFDKLLAEHRAAKELPNSRPTKVTITGTVTVSSASSSLNPLAPNTSVSTAESEAPSSPPVLSLPDTYPLPKVRNRLLSYIFAISEHLFFFFFFTYSWPSRLCSVLRVNLLIYHDVFTVNCIKYQMRLVFSPVCEQSMGGRDCWCTNEMKVLLWSCVVSGRESTFA